MSKKKKDKRRQRKFVQVAFDKAMDNMPPGAKRQDLKFQHLNAATQALRVLHKKLGLLEGGDHGFGILLVLEPPGNAPAIVMANTTHKRNHAHCDMPDDGPNHLH
jgi:hypothetical protein